MSHQLLHANTSFLAALAVASMAAVALALLVNRLAHRASAAARHAIVLAALLAPLVLVVAGAIGLRVPRSAPAQEPAEVKIAPATVQKIAVTETEIPCILALLWLAGASLALLRTAAVAARWRGVRSRAQLITDELFDAPYDLARSSEVSEPAVVGIARPMVLLPSSYDLTREEMQAVFAHELAHIARRDNLTALAVQIVCSLFWFDPLHRIARRVVVELRERVCDDLVLACGCDAAAYVAALARSCERSVAAPAVACMSRLNLQERMESIMTPHTRRRLPVAITRAFIAAAVAVAAIAFATISPAPQLIAGEAAVSVSPDFDLRVMRGLDGQYTLNVHITAPGVNFNSAAVVNAKADTHTVSTTQGGRTYTVTVHLQEDGSAAAQLDVREGDKLVDTVARAFAAPAATEPRIARSGVKRVGEVEGMIPPKAITRVDPIYTAEAKENRISGVVILETLINEQGNVERVQVLKPLPFGLDKAAVDAIRQWKWEPAMVDGKPVPVVFNLTMNFKLD